MRVLVTGASGGIGGATARAFAAEGCEVVGHWHRGAERAAALAEEIGCALVRADLTDEADVDRMYAEAGPLDVCAAVAGVWPEPTSRSGSCRSRAGARPSTRT